MLRLTAQRLNRVIAASAVILGLVPVSVRSQTHSSVATDPYLARAERILEQTPLIDGHNDLPWRIREDSIARGNVAVYDLRKRTPGHTDLDRLKKGMVGAQFWSVYTPGEWRDSGYARIQLEQIDIARRMIAKYLTVALALSANDIGANSRTVSLPPPRAQGGHAIENSLGALRATTTLACATRR
jgi:membrane dipeptidase